MVPIRYLNFDGLINTGVSDFMMPADELVAAKNVWTYKIGKVEKVPGYTKTMTGTTAAGKSSLLHRYYKPDTETNYLFASTDAGADHKLYRYDNGTTWTAIRTYTGQDGAKLSATNYLGKVFVVGHETGSTFIENATLTSSTYSSSDSDITNMPQGKFIVRYRDLLYVLYAKVGGTVYSTRAYFCDEPTAGAITWENTDTNFIDFGYDDGDAITGGVEALDRLVVFKQFSMWKYDETERQKVSDIGCDSNRSIKLVGNTLYFFNRNGFYRWNGGEPELISDKAKEFIDAIDQTKLSDVVATVYDGDEYRAFIGDVTVNEITYSHAWFCFNTRRETFYIRCTKHVVTAACEYVLAGKKRSHFISELGQTYTFAHKVDKIYSDDGEDIDSFMITKALDHDQPEDAKFTNHVTIFSNNAQGMKMAVEVDNDGEYSAVNEAVLNNDIEALDIGVTGNRFRYKFYEKGNGKSWELEGFVVETDLSEKSN